MLIDEFAEERNKIGLWIDLTNTTRYYDKRIVQRNGISYVKLQLVGYDAAPSNYEIKQFLSISNKFIQANPTQLIGIHCTHGFNRTGFLICTYLVEILKLSITDAFHQFERSRTPGIYKPAYIEVLFKRYKQFDNIPRAPKKPTWNSSVQADDQIATSQSRSHIRNELDGFELVMNPNKRADLQRKVERLCFSKNKGFPGSQPVEMNAQNLNLIFENPYKVSPNAGGTRYMMLIEGENRIYMFDSAQNVFEVKEKCPKFPKVNHLDQHIIETLLDGEIVFADDQEHVSRPTYLIRDIVRFEGKEIGDESLDTRLSCIEEDLLSARESAEREGFIDTSQELFGVKRKDFHDLNELDTLFIDYGLVFQPANEPYKVGKCFNILEWRSSSDRMRHPLTKEVLLTEIHKFI